MKRSLLKTFGVMFTVLAVVFIGCDMSLVDTEVVDAQTPVITAQPVGGSIPMGGTRSLTVDASVTDGGTLEYQWYSYATPAEYENHAGFRIQGATDSSYVPNLNREGSYNFYVIVTNVNRNVRGKRNVSLKSSPVHVSLTFSGNALFPNIITHPANVGNVIFGRNMIFPLLTVEADIEGDGEISYQWYVASTLTNEEGVAIENATTGAYRPIPTAPGQYYYFVIVSNLDRLASGRRISSVRSNPAYVQVIVNPNAVAPIITTHPQGAIYFNNDSDIEELTVAAELPEDNGDLTYQWFSNTTSSNTGGEPVDGEKNKEFTPAISTDSSATYYFYAEVTNTAALATNNKTAVTASRVAELVVTTPASLQANAMISINMNDKRQFVRGFGGMDVAWGNFPSYSFADYENLYNPDRLGYNILRIMILPHSTDIKDTMYKLTTNQISGNETRDNLYEYVKLVNRYKGYVFASPWTPPAVWKNNNSIVGSPDSVAFLRLSNYTNYAWYLRDFAQLMVDNGAPIYAISIANEPNYAATYDGCIWSANAMRNFFQQVGRFTRQGPQGSNNMNYPSDIPGYGGGKPRTYVLTMSGESANTPSIHNSAMSEPAAKQNIDILARHPYGNRQENLAGQLGAGSNVNITYHADPREVWQTEYNLNSTNATLYPRDHTWPFVWQFLNSIDITIRNNHENAYIWWSNKRWYSFLGDGQYGSRNSEILPRGWAQAHFAKFANETYQVGVTYTGNLGSGSPLTTANINPVNYANIADDNDGGSGVVTVQGAATAIKVSAYVKLINGEQFPVNWKDQDINIDEISEISFVMYTPTSITGSGGYDLGTVRLQLPTGFIIRGATAMRSTQADVGNRTNPGEPKWEQVQITEDRNAAFVTLPVSQILSVKFIR